MPEFFPQLAGLATIAFPFSKVKTSFGQNSTQRGFPSFAHPSHLSEKIIGNHGSSALARRIHLEFHEHLGFNVKRQDLKVAPEKSQICVSNTP